MGTIIDARDRFAPCVAIFFIRDLKSIAVDGRDFMRSLNEKELINLCKNSKSIPKSLQDKMKSMYSIPEDSSILIRNHEAIEWCRSQRKPVIDSLERVTGKSYSGMDYALDKLLSTVVSVYGENWKEKAYDFEAERIFVQTSVNLKDDTMGRIINDFFDNAPTGEHGEIQRILSIAMLSGSPQEYDTLLKRVGNYSGINMSYEAGMAEDRIPALREYCERASRCLANSIKEEKKNRPAEMSI